MRVFGRKHKTVVSLYSFCSECGELGRILAFGIERLVLRMKTESLSGACCSGGFTFMIPRQFETEESRKHFPRCLGKA